MMHVMPENKLVRIDGPRKILAHLFTQADIQMTHFLGPVQAHKSILLPRCHICHAWVEMILSPPSSPQRDCAAFSLSFLISGSNRAL